MPSKKKTRPKRPAHRPQALARHEKRDKLLQALRAGATRKTAAAIAGISERTFHRTMARGGTFVTQVERAEEEAVMRFVGRIAKAAHEAEVIETLGPGGIVVRRVTKYDWKAAAWWLEHHPTARGIYGPSAQAQLQVNVGVQVNQPAGFEPDRRYAAQVVAILQHAGVLPEEAEPDAVAPLLLTEAEQVPSTEPQD